MSWTEYRWKSKESPVTEWLIRIKPGDYASSFEVYEVITEVESHFDPKPLLFRSDKVRPMEFVEKLEDANPAYCSGHVKWDGCHNINYDNLMHHFCSFPGISNFFEAVKEACRLAAEAVVHRDAALQELDR